MISFLAVIVLEKVYMGVYLEGKRERKDDDIDVIEGAAAREGPKDEP